MKARFVAATIEEAQRLFGRRFYEDSLPKTQPELDERVQLGAFLRVYARLATCPFPIVVNISPKAESPDFKVTFGNAEVGIEASKIANWELEEIRSIQRQEKLGTIEISSLLQPQAKRSREQKIADCTCIPSFVFPDPDQMRRGDAFWLKQALGIITRKHTITKQPTFNRYAESWLLLWDKLSYDQELEPRIKSLTDSLVHLWESDFFRKVIIQHQHSDWFFILSRQGVEILRPQPVMPITEFSLPEDLDRPPHLLQGA